MPAGLALMAVMRGCDGLATAAVWLKLLQLAESTAGALSAVPIKLRRFMGAPKKQIGAAPGEGAGTGQSLTSKLGIVVSLRQNEALQNLGAPPCPMSKP